MSPRAQPDNSVEAGGQVQKACRVPDVFDQTKFVEFYNFGNLGGRIYIGQKVCVGEKGGNY